jgi:DNA-binding transcriptional ArsR family regulator
MKNYIREKNNFNEGILLKKLKAISGTTRFKILLYLYKYEKACACELSEYLGISIPAAFNHLKKLFNENVLNSQIEGKIIFYSLNKDESIVKFLNNLIKEAQYGCKGNKNN